MFVTARSKNCFPLCSSLMTNLKMVYDGIPLCPIMISRKYFPQNRNNIFTQAQQLFNTVILSQMNYAIFLPLTVEKVFGDIYFYTPCLLFTY